MEEEQKKERKLLWENDGKNELNKDLLLWLKIVGIGIFLFASAIVINNQFNLLDSGGDGSDSGSYAEDSTTEENCNVRGLALHGDIVTYISPENYDADGNQLSDETASENVLYSIEEAEKDDSIKAIILEVDSYGGSPVAGEEIANALKSAKKPTVALVRSAAASAAYWASTGASRIFASNNSDVGSIGVTMSYLDSVEQNKKVGYTYNLLSSGKFKDTGDPDKPLSAEEVNLIMRDINIMHQNFIKNVSDNRKLGLEKVTSLADGSTMLGEAALQNGLIDEIGNQAEVNKYLKEKLGEDVEICW